MKKIIENFFIFILLNVCNYVVWSIVSWDFNPGEWGWFARLIALIIFIASFKFLKLR